jgi:lipopolysaccharide export system protein LptA
VTSKGLISAPLTAACAVVATLCFSLPAHAERADRDKPTQIESDRMSSDEARGLTTFDGNVVVTQGTIAVRADRIVVRQDGDGLRHITATGNPVRFKQRTDANGGKPGVWIDGEALRVEIDERTEKVELFENARLTRDRDEVRGNHISLDQRAESFSVTSGAQTPEGRVRAVIQPKAQPPTK